MQNISDPGSSHQRAQMLSFTLTTIWIANYFTHEFENKYVLQFTF